MARIAELLERKGELVVRISADTTVHQAVQKMVQFAVGSLLVTDHGRIAGIFTERDYLRRVALQGLPPETPVRKVLTSELVVIGPQDSVLDCMAVMTQRRIRHVPVLDGDRLCGMISIGDLVESLSREQEVEIQYLREYINGSY